MRGRKKSAYHGGSSKSKTFTSKNANEATSLDEKHEATKLANTIDESMGFARYESGKKKTGWLVNVKSTSIEDDKYPEGRAGLDCYFIEDDGGTFKATLEYEPYFLVAVKRGHETEAEEWLKRAPGDGCVKSLKKVEKEDLQMPNHLLGYRRTFFECRFRNEPDLMAARRDIMPIAEKNKKNMNAMDTYAEVARYVFYPRGRESWANLTKVQMLDSTFLMTTVMIIDDLILLLLMLAILLLRLENGMSHITFE